MKVLLSRYYCDVEAAFENFPCCPPHTWTQRPARLPPEFLEMDLTHVFFFPDQEKKTQNCTPPPSMQRWQCVRMAAVKKATVTGNYLNRVKIKKQPTM